MTSYEAALRVEMISLEARYNAARGHSLNQDMQVESRLLTAQLAAIKREIIRIGTIHLQNAEKVDDED